MNLKLWQEFAIVVVCVVSVFVIIGTPMGFLIDGGFATEAAIEVCSGDNMELSQIWGIQTNRCWVEACDNQFDGIEFCETRSFMVQNGYFQSGVKSDS